MLQTVKTLLSDVWMYRSWRACWISCVVVLRGCRRTHDWSSGRNVSRCLLNMASRLSLLPTSFRSWFSSQTLALYKSLTYLLTYLHTSTNSSQLHPQTSLHLVSVCYADWVALYDKLECVARPSVMAARCCHLASATDLLTPIHWTTGMAGE